MAKYIQKESSKYLNNEFENMPSIDYRYLANDVQLDTKNKEIVDWGLVSTICEKHGFSYTIISGTFGRNCNGNFNSYCIIYKKVDITHEQYSEWYNNKDFARIHEEQNKYKETYKALHNCIHELDEETDLAFDTGWGGNCGVFGDIIGESYSPCDYFTDWNFIIDRWHPSINDTNSKLSKGVYIIMVANNLKTIAHS